MTKILKVRKLLTKRKMFLARANSREAFYSQNYIKQVELYFDTELLLANHL